MEVMVERANGPQNFPGKGKIVKIKEKFKTISRPELFRFQKTITTRPPFLNHFQVKILMSNQSQTKKPNKISPQP